MDNEDSVLSEIYEILLQLRYPEITKAESKDIGSTILTGESRISLLSWLLQQQSELVGNVLSKLSGAALEDELVKYYSQIGICNNKDLLLGRCSPNAGLSTVKLLLEFMKNVHCQPAVQLIKETSIEDILHAHITKDSKVIPLVNNVNGKMTYEAAIEYFRGIEKDMENSADPVQEEVSSAIETFVETEECVECNNDTDKEGNFLAEKEKFIAAFSTIPMQQTCTKSDKKTANSMDENIKSIHSNFSSLTQMLEAKDKIAKLHLPKDLHHIDSPLTKVIQDIVACAEEIKNTRINDSGVE